MKNLFILCPGICLLIFLMGCATAPKQDVLFTTAIADTRVKADPPAADYEQARAYQQLIRKYELYTYSADGYQRAEQAFKEGEEAYQKNNYPGARTAFALANREYKQVIADGFPRYFDIKEKEAIAVRRAAEEIKAQVALKTNYTRAVQLWVEAMEAKQAGKYTDGADLLASAYAVFQEVYVKTKEKKERAEKSLEELGMHMKQLQELGKTHEPADKS